MTLGPGPWTCSDLICLRPKSWSFVLTVRLSELTIADQVLNPDFKTGCAMEIIAQKGVSGCPDPTGILRRVRPKLFFVVVSSVSGLSDLGLAIAAPSPLPRHYLTTAGT